MRITSPIRSWSVGLALALTLGTTTAITVATSGSAGAAESTEGTTSSTSPGDFELYCQTLVDGLRIKAVPHRVIVEPQIPADVSPGDQVTVPVSVQITMTESERSALYDVAELREIQGSAADTMLTANDNGPDPAVSLLESLKLPRTPIPEAGPLVLGVNGSSTITVPQPGTRFEISFIDVEASGLSSFAGDETRVPVTVQCSDESPTGPTPTTSQPPTEPTASTPAGPIVGDGQLVCETRVGGLRLGATARQVLVAPQIPSGAAPGDEVTAPVSLRVPMTERERSAAYELLLFRRVQGSAADTTLVAGNANASTTSALTGLELPSAQIPASGDWALGLSGTSTFTVPEAGAAFSIPALSIDAVGSTEDDETESLRVVCSSSTPVTPTTPTASVPTEPTSTAPVIPAPQFSRQLECSINIGTLRYSPKLFDVRVDPSIPEGAVLGDEVTSSVSVKVGMRADSRSLFYGLLKAREVSGSASDTTMIVGDSSRAVGEYPLTALTMPTARIPDSDPWTLLIEGTSTYIVPGAGDEFVTNNLRIEGVAAETSGATQEFTMDCGTSLTPTTSAPVPTGTTIPVPTPTTVPPIPTTPATTTAVPPSSVTPTAVPTTALPTTALPTTVAPPATTAPPKSPCGPAPSNPLKFFGWLFCTIQQVFRR